MIWNAILRGGSKHGHQFFTHNPLRYPGLGYDTLNGTPTEMYWYTGKTDKDGRFIFRSEGRWWRFKRKWYARLGYRVRARPAWAPQPKPLEEEEV